MCKLCNTDRKPLITTKYKFLEEVNDYLGENPCTVCLSTINKSHNKDPGKSIDSIIIKKLYLLNRTFVSKELGNARQALYNKVTNILGIRIIETPEHTSYYPRIKNSSTGPVIYLPVSNTLQEAVQVKYDYMVANGHTKGLTQLKNKLKELSNDNN